MKIIAGLWIAFQVHLFGMDATTLTSTPGQLEVVDNSYKIIENGKVKSSGLLVYYEGTNKVDFKETVGDLNTLRGIYKSSNDTLTVCLNFEDDYPTEFKSTADNKYILINYKYTK